MADRGRTKATKSSSRKAAVPSEVHCSSGAHTEPGCSSGAHTEPGCSSGAHTGPGGKAVGVDPDGKERNRKRLRRIEGQVRGLQKMVEEDRYCADILTQISSVHEALRAVARELMRNHLKHCASAAIRAGEPQAEAMYEELLELMYRYLR